MKKTRLLALSLALALILALGGCTGDTDPTPTPTSDATPTPTAAISTPTAEPTAQPTADTDPDAVKVLMLKGPTGMGAAKLMADAEAGAAAQKYAFTVDADPGAVPAKLTSGEVDIAALPTNVAANLYNKTDDIQMLALNTLGVLYILEQGNSVRSIGDLAGKTIYATGQGSNPEFVLNFLLEQNGLTPGEDVIIQWKASDELATLAAAGDVDLCMLPVPSATTVLMKNGQMRAALDLTEEWDRASSDGSVLTMGCVVARREFIDEHPDAVDTFLTEYAASIEYIKAGGEDAAALVAQCGIVPSAEVAAAAIPQANLICTTGRDMAASIQGYYFVLWQADPASVGGGLPDDGFYYAP